MYLLKEVVFAVDLVALGEALVRQLDEAVGTLEAARVPRPVEHLQDEPVQDRLAAPRALRYGGCTKKKKKLNKERMSPKKTQPKNQH